MAAFIIYYFIIQVSLLQTFQGKRTFSRKNSHHVSRTTVDYLWTKSHKPIKLGILSTGNVLLCVVSFWVWLWLYLLVLWLAKFKTAHCNFWRSCWLCFSWSDGDANMHTWTVLKYWKGKKGCPGLMRIKIMKQCSEEHHNNNILYQRLEQHK